MNLTKTHKRNNKSITETLVDRLMSRSLILSVLNMDQIEKFNTLLH